MVHSCANVSVTHAGGAEFNWENKITMDTCALAAKQQDNDAIYNYRTFNFFQVGATNCTEKKAQLDFFTYQYPNLRFRDGYGLANSCVIDEDSAVRYNADGLTHGKEPQQLFARNFYAVPNFGRGGLVPNTETFLKNGIDTTSIRQCDPIVERNWASSRNADLEDVGCIVKNPVPVMTLGEDSRQIMRKMRMDSCKK